MQYNEMKFIGVLLIILLVITLAIGDKYCFVINIKNIKIFLKNERGFLLLNVVFLTLITSLSAMILIKSDTRIKNFNSTLKLTALYLANEQIAYLESIAANGEQITGNYSFKGDPNDLISENAHLTTHFVVETKVLDNLNPRKVAIKVTWNVETEIFVIESERMIWINETSTQE